MPLKQTASRWFSSQRIQRIALLECLIDTGRVPYRVGICEDDPFTLTTLEAALEQAGFKVCFASSSAADALAKATVSKNLDAAVLDVHLGQGPTGLDLARSIRRQHSECGFVFLTSFENPKLVEPDFLGLPTGSQYITKASVRSVHDITNAVESAINRQTSKVQDSGLASELTSKQLDVLGLIAEGLSNAEIARTLGLSEETIEGSVRRIAKRLGIVRNPSLNQRVLMARAYLKAVGGVL